MQTKNINQQYSVAAVGLCNTGTGEFLSQYTRELEQVIYSYLEVDGNADKIGSSNGGACKLTPPPYRMPPQPLYSEPVSIPGSATPSIQQMHTHSNKFPIEREVILSNYDKNSKIPILNEYHRKQKGATAALDAPSVQIAWTEERTNRTYGEMRNTPNANLADGMNVEVHRTYKAQPLALLETTNGSEPSPIVNLKEDSNGLSPSNYAKVTGRSHSTPEADAANSKPFSARTYHTIKDMISSRFSGKGKADQIPETGLNNSESHTETPKTDNNLSPHSQLVQRGVYLANSQSCNRNPSTSYNNNGTDMIARRNQEVRDQILNQYRERAVDVGQTVGVSQQCTNTTPNVNLANGRYPQESESMPMAQSSRRTVLDCETPNRFRDQPLAKSIQRFEHAAENESRSSRYQEGYERVIKTNETGEASGPPVYPKPVSVTNHNKRSIYEHRNQTMAHGKSYTALAPSSVVNGNPPKREAPVGCSSTLAKTEDIVDVRPCSSSQLPADTKYGSVTNAMERCNISRARSNDHLLETTNDKSPYARKDLPLKQKAKSFESLGNDNEDELDKLDAKSSGPLSGMNSDYEKHRGGGQSDSGRGSTVYSSGKLKNMTDTSPDSSEPHRVAATKDNQWVDRVENELKHILEPKSNASIVNSTLSDSSASPPLPPVSPDVSSDDMTRTYKHKSMYGNKTETPYRLSVPSSHNNRNQWWRSNTKEKIHQRLAVSMKRPENISKMPSTIASSSIDLDSMLDEENNTSDGDMSISDTRAIRKQLEGLENMYSEVMKVLGVRKPLNRYPNFDPRMNKRRLYGSVSSLPSSVSSRPVRDRHRRTDERKKFVRDIKGINKRFQRLESHVVTLARSVAHLSSEMRTQHLMIQEMEVIRNELTNLRAQTNMLTVRSQSMPRFNPIQNSEQVNSSPSKMKKLTKFFGDEPPLLRLFLKKLGYEKYANMFEKERIGLVELPYLSEERLQKLGIPMGPRLRIIQEAQLGFPGTHENTLCIV